MVNSAFRVDVILGRKLPLLSIKPLFPRQSKSFSNIGNICPNYMIIHINLDLIITALQGSLAIRLLNSRVTYIRPLLQINACRRFTETIFTMKPLTTYFFLAFMKICFDKGKHFLQLDRIVGQAAGKKKERKRFETESIYTERWGGNNANFMSQIQ